MKAHKINTIRQALEKRDLTTLDALTSPGQRPINRSSRFRSALMLSAHNLKHLLKIDSLDAECIMFNLEDGVSPEEKPFALRLCAIFLTELGQSDKKLVVRVNPLDEGGLDEIRYLNPFRPDAIRVPKINNSKEVQTALDELNEEIELHLSIETSEAWNNLPQLAIDQRVTTYYLGTLDLFADLALPQSLITVDNPTLLYMLSRFLVTSRACGVKPVSFVYQDFRNLEGFREWIEIEKRMGFTAKGCISPKQVSVLHAVLSDAGAEIEQARAIVERFEKQAAKGVTGFVDEEYGFIDEPIYKGALAVLNSS